MPKMIFLDFLQMVRPGKKALDPSLFDFYVFGSFDALKVSAHAMEERNFSLAELHRIGKERRQRIPGHFDRQPMYLYTQEREAEEIFRTDGIDAVRPLVLTLIQLRDPVINLDTPEKLAGAFRTRINECIDTDSLPTVDFRVFFCLGEPDLVIAFRYDRLQEIGRLIYRIRLWEPEENGKESDGICVLSTSSHCAFPGGARGDLLRERIRSWAGKEEDFRFLTLFDTSYGLEDNSIRTRENGQAGLLHTDMLLGDWDYGKEWTGKDAPDILADHILKPVTDFDEDSPGSFRSSASFPVIGLTDKELPYGPSKRTLSDFPEDNLLTDYEGETTAFTELADAIRTCCGPLYGGEERTKNLSNIVLSMQGTLNGILKHLYQLRDGRGQYDLYACVIPAFEALPGITRNTADLVRRFHEGYGKLSDAGKEKNRNEYMNSVGILLDTYIHDTSRLLAELQHLFSVLSISPHTYLESYGSNMRFVTAACKLLVAYQGIACNLSSHYGMDLRTEGGTVQPKEVMLVIPYRRIRQSTQVLFHCTGPENRIVYIRINSSDMLRVRKTVFMLLHECGHHILNYDFREQRASCFFKTYVGHLLDRAFGPLYRDPLSGMQAILSDREAYMRGRKDPMRIRSFKTSGEDLGKSIILDLYEKQNLSRLMEDFWEERYREQPHVKLFSEPVSLDNHFLDYVRECACSSMQEWLDWLDPTFLDQGTGGKPDFSDNELAQSLADIVYYVIFFCFHIVADSEYGARLHDDDKDLWHLSELKTVYAMFSKEAEQRKKNDRWTSDKVRRIIEWICSNSFRPVYSQIADETKTAFSDIYSDVFASLILGYDKEQTGEDRIGHDKMLLEAEAYLEILEEETGFLIGREFFQTHRIMRALVLLETVFGLSEEEIIALFEKRYPMKKDAGKYVLEMTGRVGYRYLKDYAQELCIPQVRRQIGNSPALKTDMKHLKKMYRGSEDGEGAEAFMNAVYYFWKASTQREKQERKA